MAVRVGKFSRLQSPEYPSVTSQTMACSRLVRPKSLRTRNFPASDSSGISIKGLAKFATAFREALVQCNPAAYRSLSFRGFPSGSCGDTSLLLIEAFIEREVDAKHAVGYYRRSSHAWVMVEGIIIDLTADQFDDIQKPVIVTRHSLWHNRFNATITDKRFQDTGPEQVLAEFKELHSQISIRLRDVQFCSLSRYSLR